MEHIRTYLLVAIYAVAPAGATPRCRHPRGYPRTLTIDNIICIIFKLKWGI